MAPNKEWMKLIEHGRIEPEYREGVLEFINYAFERTGQNVEILCPCKGCMNSLFRSRDEVYDHLIVKGILPGYTFWYHHGERLNENVDKDVQSDPMVEENDRESEIATMLKDVFHGVIPEPSIPSSSHGGESDSPNTKVNEPELKTGAKANEPNDEAKRYHRIFEDFQTPLYEGCGLSKLSSILKLLHIKNLGRWSNESFTMLLELLKNELLPKESTLPASFKKANKIVSDLGFSYIKIDACENDCMLFWKEHKGADYCDICKVSRWKHEANSGEIKLKKNGRPIPKKVLRYFPLKQRLQRLFMCSKTASDMTWHHHNHSKDGVMRHPCDSEGWKKFLEDNPDFAADERNVILTLLSDGFTPFSNYATPYSVWPVKLIPYNFPPWVCMKQSNFILSMLIPGPHGPGKAIDVYLQPLVEELRELREIGVQTFDASRQENFNLHAALISTINDYSPRNWIIRQETN